MAGSYKTLGWILWTFGGADASAASTWFGLRHERRTAYSVFEFWVLRFRDFGVFVFEVWVLRASVFVFETTDRSQVQVIALLINNWNKIKLYWGGRGCLGRSQIFWKGARGKAGGWRFFLHLLKKETLVCGFFLWKKTIKTILITQGVQRE